MTKLIGYSFIGPLLAVPNGHLSQPHIYGDRTTFNFDVTFPTGRSIIAAGGRLWADACDIELISVTDSNHAIGTTADPVFPSGGVVRNYAVDYQYSPGDATIAAMSSLNYSDSVNRYIAWNGTWGKSLEEVGYGISGHELGHCVIGRPDMPSDPDPTQIMNYGFHPVINAGNKAAAEAVYGAAKTYSQKMAQGLPLGEIWSCYMGGVGYAPPNDALLYWHQRWTAGTLDINSMAASLVSGASTPAFVRQVYTNVLGRPAETTAENYWAAPGVTAAACLAGIAGSPEAATRRQTLFSGGLWFS